MKNGIYNAKTIHILYLPRTPIVVENPEFKHLCYKRRGDSERDSKKEELSWTLVPMLTTNAKNQLLNLLKRVCFLLDNSKESDWSPLSPKEVKANIETEMDLIRQGHAIDKDQLIIEFLPTSTLQEIAMVSNWHEEYIRLAKKFDLLIQSF
ncbi:MAG: hypothetical protein Roseis2KO_45380 [Roseivirga sp.]